MTRCYALAFYLLLGFLIVLIKEDVMVFKNIYFLFEYIFSISFVLTILIDKSL